MSVCRFSVTGIALQHNIRGQDMRRVTLIAIDSEPFTGGELPDGVPAPSPEGQIVMLVSPSFAKKLALGDEFALERRS
jgi:hypothetical protein